MNEVVKHHNDLNKIKLPSFTEQEQNMLFGIVTRIKDKPAGESIKLTPQELLNFSTENLTRKALGDMLFVLREKFFKADFTILVEDKERDLIGKKTINLFQEFTLWYPKGDDKYDYLLNIELKVNPTFEYLINELTGNFTRFELAEFIALSGKYTKTLYRLLKQYRATGTAKFEWEDFKRIMDIPDNYRQTDIDQFILKPALKELTKEHNLFDQDRVCFKNLKYTKIKGKGRGRGGVVIGIEFTFTPETKNADKEKIQELEKENKALEQKLQISKTREQQTNQKNLALIEQFNIGQEFGNFIGLSFYNEQGEIIKIKDMWKDYDTLKVRFENRENEKTFVKEFDNEKHLDNYLKKFVRL